MTKLGETCDCRHPVDPHVLVAMAFDVVAGIPNVPVAGVMICPACDCIATWATDGRPPPPVPAPETLAELRQMIKASAGKPSGEEKE